MTVTEYANKYHYSEFNVFELAYRHYYGNMDKRRINIDFGQYMFYHNTPVYVNAFLRKQTELEA